MPRQVIFDRAQRFLEEAREEALSVAKNKELENIIPLANAEEALGTFYGRRQVAQARTCYKRLVELWQHYPEPSEYVDRRKALAARLLASVS